MSPLNAPRSTSSVPKEFPEIKYQRSAQFRVIHCDGAFGGFTPKRLLGMSLYAERNNLPDKSVLNVDDEGMLRERLVFSKREIIRQVEATVLLSVDDAESLGSWILEQVKQARKNM